MAATRTAQLRPGELNAGGHEICTPERVRRSVASSVSVKGHLNLPTGGH